MSSLPARMKKIRSKMKGLKCEQDYMLLFFFRRSKAANSVVSGRIIPKFELIQAFIVVLITCKNEEDPIKMEALECLQDFPHYKSMGFFFSNAQGQLTLQSLVKSGPNSNSSEILWFSS